ncbi:hypothetical protein [Arthrobacter sp. CG_A4]|uniref:hypothetical protein n=1 Tax=Arthrobacter sp. CG_A4 TaxID=3071706 RepID=UPI002DF9CC4F|nr:hypothetical protein [Arthrobacter sp. CG_A4]
MNPFLAPADSGEGGIDFLSLLGPGTVITILVVAMVLVLVAAMTVWLLLRRVRRSGALQRLQGGLGNAVQGGLLRMRAETGEGLGRELAQKRLDLKAALDSTGRSLDLARAQQRPVGELPAILDTLARAGAVLDGQLGLAEREPDDGARRAMAAALDGQLEMIEHTARDIRSTLAEAGLSLGGADLDKVTARLAIESQVLKTWTQSYSASGNPAEGTPGDDTWNPGPGPHDPRRP